MFPPCYLLGPNYGGGDEDNGNLFQKIPCMYCYTHCPQLYSRPLWTHASTGNSWTLPGKSASVSSKVTESFSWVLVHTRFCLSPLRVYFPVLCKFWHLYGGVNCDLLKTAYAIPKSAAPRAPAPAKSTADPYLHRRYSNRALFQSRWGLWVLVHTRFV